MFDYQWKTCGFPTTFHLGVRHSARHGVWHQPCAGAQSGTGSDPLPWGL